METASSFCVRVKYYWREAVRSLELMRRDRVFVYLIFPKEYLAVYVVSILPHCVSYAFETHAIVASCRAAVAACGESARRADFCTRNRRNKYLLYAGINVYLWRNCPFPSIHCNTYFSIVARYISNNFVFDVRITSMRNSASLSLSFILDDLNNNERIII